MGSVTSPLATRITPFTRFAVSVKYLPWQNRNSGEDSVETGKTGTGTLLMGPSSCKKKAYTDTVDLKLSPPPP